MFPGILIPSGQKGILSNTSCLCNRQPNLWVFTSFRSAKVASDTVEMYLFVQLPTVLMQLTEIAKDMQHPTSAGHYGPQSKPGEQVQHVRRARVSPSPLFRSGR